MSDATISDATLSYAVSFFYLLLSTGLSCLFLTLVFRPLESVFPAKPGQRYFRPDWLLDLTFLAGQYLVWNTLVMALLFEVDLQLLPFLPGEFRAAVAALPWWWQAIAVIVLSDLLIYWGHRLQHRVGFLWRFHSIHHTAEHLDWLAAHREHPLDTVFTMGLVNLPAFLLGIPLEGLTGFIAFRGLWAIYIHSNVRLQTGPLRWIFGAPELHHWHHDKARDAGNYANLSPLMDLLFGTYRCPDHEPEAFGIAEPAARSYLGHMLRPLLPKPRRS